MPQPLTTPDLLQISLGTTIGLRVADAWFEALARDAGVTVESLAVRVGATRRLRRAYPVTDLVEAVAARRATASALRHIRPRAVVFSSTTAALLAGDPGCPYAVRLDSPARLNRPGKHNAVVHALERRRLANARLVLPWSVAADQALPAGSARSIVVSPPLSLAAEPAPDRERLAVAYTPDPKAKGLDLLVEAWKRANVPDARVEVFGIERDQGLRYIARFGLREPANLRWRGRTSQHEFHAALGRAQTFITSARWEDFGMAQLEALALGALLVCSATEGPFEARAIASELAPELVAGDQSSGALAVAVERAFSIDADFEAMYRRKADEWLVPYGADAIVRTIAEQVLPVLLAA